ncbi:tellurite resistance TerB family protein [Pseudofrankia asymbiotica]|uniref:NUDIX hydrolase n=1 Tax=Pseudofrankia asymbiotica TaxID=1834516 RepID=A0A1V2IJ63_9ACTN|nr:TerB family tellurite resistance protein [Pseudofrankia asymbiotica]ONH33233.1 NUDIX hydrolase [Pseudofrankia asymbiotica]
MAVLPAIRLDARMVARTAGRVLLTREPGQLWHALPGGPVDPDEGTQRSLARHLGELAGPLTGARARDDGQTAAAGASPGPSTARPPAPARIWRFVGAVEHTGDAGDARDADPADESWARGTPGAEHVLTLLFAADWPEGLAVPTSWRGRDVSAVRTDDLVVTRLAPLPVAWATRRWLAQGYPVWRSLAPGAARAAWYGSQPPVATLRGQLAARRDQLRGRRFRDAAVAMCALVAAADGRIDPAERDGLRAFLATDPVMANFPAAELEQAFDAHVAALAADADAGRRAILADVARVRGRPAEATAVLRLGEVIGRIDGAFPPVEQAVLAEAARALGLDPAPTV